MKYEKALKITQKTDSEFGKQDFLNGLLILAKYDDDIDPWYEHDQIWCSSIEVIEKMSEEDIKSMAKFGWFIDEEGECWSHF